MNFFNRHMILKSLAVITSSIFVMVIAYLGGVYLAVTPHVALSYATAGLLSSWFISNLYDSVVLKKGDRQAYRLLCKQRQQIATLQSEVKELQKLNGTHKEPYKK